MLHLDRTRAEVFGEVAELYDATRPTYPPALIDELLAEHPSAVLDVGCGTGIVSALLAARGADVLGIEPDPRMAAVARAKGIAVEESAFESWESRERRFGLITAGQSWHWVAPQAGADKAAEILDPAGRLAVFWNFGQLPEPLVERLNTVYAGFAGLGLDDAAILRGRRSARAHETEAVLAAHPAFEGVQSRLFGWSREYTTEQWVGQLATHSDHATLPAPTRARLLDRIRAVIDAHGGSFTVDYHVVLVSARRASRSGHPAQRSASST